MGRQGADIATAGSNARPTPLRSVGTTSRGVQNGSHTARYVRSDELTWVPSLGGHGSGAPPTPTIGHTWIRDGRGRRWASSSISAASFRPFITPGDPDAVEAAIIERAKVGPAANDGRRGPVV